MDTIYYCMPSYNSAFNRLDFAAGKIISATPSRKQLCIKEKIRAHQRRPRHSRRL